VKWFPSKSGDQTAKTTIDLQQGCFLFYWYHLLGDVSATLDWKNQLADALELQNTTATQFGFSIFL